MADFNVNIYDEAWALDNPVTVILDLAVNLFDSVVAGEDVAMLADEPDANISIYDGIVAGEGIETAQESFSNVNDAISVADIVTTFIEAVADFNVAIHDAVAVAEVVTGYPHALFRSVFDGVAIAEAVTVSDIATTLAYSKNVVHLTSIDSNWWWTDVFPGSVNGILLVTIQFYAAGADTLVFRDGAMDGPIMTKIVTAAAGNFTVNFDRTRVRPCLNIADCSLSATSSVSLIYDH